MSETGDWRFKGRRESDINKGLSCCFQRWKEPHGRNVVGQSELSGQWLATSKNMGTSVLQLQRIWKQILPPEASEGNTAHFDILILALEDAEQRTHSQHARTAGPQNYEVMSGG